MAAIDVAGEVRVCPVCEGRVRRWTTTAFDLRMRPVLVGRARCTACGWDHTATSVQRARPVPRDGVED